MISPKHNVITYSAIVTFFLLTTFFPLMAQKFANNWVFANYELNFNAGSPVVSRSYAPHLNRGMGVISDKDGVLLFYTDGYSVWNRDHRLMHNGSNLITLHGFTSTQESIIIPKPGDDTKFYIFTVDPWNGQSTSGLYYSEVDLALEGGLGDVTTKGIKLISKTSNKLSATYHENQQDVWVMTHGSDTDKYYTLLITDEGISSDIIEQQIGPLHSERSGQMKFSPDGKKVAVSHSNLSLFDFNPATGELSNAMNFSPGVAGLEFSSDATKLYGDAGNVVQYDISLPTFEQIRDSRKQAGRSILYNSLRQFQLGPDGKIYITKGGGGGGTQHLGVIVNPNANANEVELQENGLFLEGGESFVNYTPNFIQNYFFKTSFSFDNTCQSARINFRVTNNHRLDSVKWFFGEGSISTSLRPQFSYAIPGDYTVELHAYYAGKAVVVSQLIKINPYTTFELGADTTLCYGSKLSITDNFVSYQWNTGDTTRSVRVENSGMYRLTAQNQLGCLFEDSVDITVEALPVIDLADTVLVGQLDSVKIDPGAFPFYSWNTGQTSSSFYAKKEGWYSVAVKNAAGCMSARSFYVQKNATPEVEEATRWIRLNPIPSGATARDAFFFDDQRGFIVTDAELLRTTDGGANWNVQLKMTSPKRIAFKNMIGYIAGSRGLIYKSTHFGDGWNKLNLNSSDDINAITVLHEDTVILTSDNKVFKSADGGQSWTTHTVNISGINIEDSYFVSGQVGHAACRGGTIIKTVDGGETWRITLSSNVIPSDFFRLKFVNREVGFATRQHSYIFKTIDGGETWKEISSYPDAGYAMQFLNEKEWIIAGEHGAIHKTTDGGMTWKWIGFNGRIWANDINAIQFVNENIGFAAGMRGRIIKTMDGGRTWQEYAPTYVFVKQVEFNSKDIGYMLAGSTFYKSTNGGFKWEQLGAPLEGQKTGQFDFVNDQVGYAIAGGSEGTSAHSGAVYKTTDGGKTWNRAHTVYELAMEDLVALHFVNENLGFVGGGYNWNVAMKTVDGGKTWTAMKGASRFGEIQFVNEQVGFARNTYNYYRRVYKTVDSGDTWEVIFENDSDINAFHFLDESVGYLVGYPDSNYKTIDGGKTWEKLKLPYEYYRDVRFLSNDVGFVLDEEGAIFRTVDGGLSWEREHSTYGLSFLGIFNDEVFAAGEFGSVFKRSITLRDLLRLDTPTLVNLTDSTAAITSYVKSFTSLISASLIAQIGTNPEVYDQAVVLEKLSGVADKPVNYQFHKLKPGTTYYCRLKIVDEDQTVISKQLVFTTPLTLITGTLPESSDFRIDIYPNPTSHSINVDVISAAQASNYAFYDILGKPLMAGPLPSHGVVDISGLSAGIYLLSVRNGEYQKTVRIVKK